MSQGMREYSAFNNSSSRITEGGDPAETLSSNMVKLELSSLRPGRTSQSLENIVRQVHLEVVAIVTVDRMFERSSASSTHDMSL